MSGSGGRVTATDPAHVDSLGDTDVRPPADDEPNSAKEGSPPGSAAAIAGVGVVAPDDAHGERAAEDQPGSLEDDEKWSRVSARLSAEQRQVVDHAMELAGHIVGPTAPPWQRLEAISQEYLGTHEASELSDCADPIPSADDREWIEPLKEWLEEETAQWTRLFQIGEVPAPRLASDADTDVRAIDEELRRLIAMRDRWDEVLDHVAMLFRMLRGWEILGFASFGHYSDERLGMAERTIEQRAALESRLYRLPSLRRAMRERKLTYEKARLIARHADDETVGVWVDRAERMTCIDLRRKLQAKEEAQMCARGEFGAWVPLRVRGLVALAFSAARTAAGYRLSPGECLVRIAEHFIGVWGPALHERSTPRQRVRKRDGGFCRTPGCSRGGGHGHHIDLRSAGGSDDPSNLVSVCAAHHLHALHTGWARVTGKAPDALRWELGVRPGLPPLEVFVSTPDGVVRVEQPAIG